MSQLYQAPNADDLIQHQLDSMTLIFQKASGITHIVADPVPAILEVMNGGKMNAEMIAGKLSARFDVEEGADVEEVVLARLDELHKLGLVEAVST